MSRSKPTGDTTPNPAVRTYEWSGKRGDLSYYDKAADSKITVQLPFGFLYLDKTSSVGGWHKPSDSGIYSNEIRSVVEEPLVVKAFKGGKLAEGMWTDIRERVAACKGHFQLNVYLGYKCQEGLEIGRLRLKGAALSAWFEFTKDKSVRKRLDTEAVIITGSVKKVNGDVPYLVPVFGFKVTTPEMNEAATELDRQLQDYFDDYFSRTQKPATVPVASAQTHEDDGAPEPEEPGETLPVDDDCPF